MHLKMFCLCPSLGEVGVWEEYFSLNARGKHTIVQLNFQKTAVTVKMTTTFMLILGTVDLKKTHKVVVTLGAENKLYTT